MGTVYIIILFGRLRCRKAGEAAAVVIGVAEQRVDHGQALEIMADGELVGHAHAAMQLHRRLADQARYR